MWANKASWHVYLGKNHGWTKCLISTSQSWEFPGCRSRRRWWCQIIWEKVWWSGKPNCDLCMRSGSHISYRDILRLKCFLRLNYFAFSLNHPVPAQIHPWIKLSRVVPLFCGKKAKFLIFDVFISVNNTICLAYVK